MNFTIREIIRDLTYIDDCVECLFNALDLKKSISMTNEGLRPDTSSAPWFIYNISSGRSIELRYLIEVIEKNLGIKKLTFEMPLFKKETLRKHLEILQKQSMN